MPPKSTYNTRYTIAGVILLVLVLFFYKNNSIEEKDLDTLNITVSTVKKIGGKGQWAYYVWSKEYECTFGIDNSAGAATDWSLDKLIAPGDELRIQLYPQTKEVLGTGSERVHVFSMTKGDAPIFTLGDYNRKDALKHKRYSMIGLFMGILLLLRGLNILSSRASIWIAGLGIAFVLITRIFNLWFW